MSAALLAMVAVLVQPDAAPPTAPSAVRVQLQGSGTVFSGASTTLLLVALDAEGQRIKAFNGTLEIQGLERFSTREQISRVGPF